MSDFEILGTEGLPDDEYRLEMIEVARKLTKPDTRFDLVIDYATCLADWIESAEYPHNRKLRFDTLRDVGGRYASGCVYPSTDDLIHEVSATINFIRRKRR